MIKIAQVSVAIAFDNGMMVQKILAVDVHGCVWEFVANKWKQLPEVVK